MSRFFDGVDDRVDMGDVIDIPPATDISLAAWIKPQQAAVSWIFGKKGALGSTAGYQLAISANPAIRSTVSDGTDVNNLIGNMTLTLDEWHFLAFTFDASIGLLRNYTDGVFDNQKEIANIGSLTNAQAFRIGESGNGTTDFNGSVAHVMMYDRLLSHDEIRFIQRFPGSISNGLRGFWPLVGGSPEPDWSGNGLNGTLNGTTLSSDGPPIAGIFHPLRFGWEYGVTTPAAAPAAAPVTGRRPRRMLTGVGL